MEWKETSLHRVLNEALRSENRQALKIWFPYLKLFDTALDLLPTVKESVWRGVPLDIGKNYTRNQIFTWWTVSSCSSAVNVTETFLKDKKNSMLFLIEVIISFSSRMYPFGYIRSYKVKQSEIFVLLYYVK